MKVNTLLKQAAKCKSEADAKALCERLQEAFGATRALGHLDGANADWSMELPENTALAYVELHHVISNYYIAEIRLEIRYGALTALVSLNHMRDGLGMQSQNYKVVPDLEEDISDTAELTIAQVAEKAKTAAIQLHANLLERVGVLGGNGIAALRHAVAVWNGSRK